MSWPTPQDYNEAVQNPLQNFSDDELRNAVIAMTSLGLPRVASGNFASVYRLRCRQRTVALRCFLSERQGQQERYSKISRYVMSDDLPYTVGFEYLAQGIRVQGSWYPAVKMEWVEGQSLDTYVRTHLWNKEETAALAEKFKTMAAELKRGGIAHGDLQHGNIIVNAEGELRLVDYDGMYVPELEGWTSDEIGHRNYQHPGRDRLHFGAWLDNYSAWSIYTSLLCLSRDPSLAEALGGCDECLLFRQNDYKYPLRSHSFYLLETHADPQIQEWSRRFRSLLDRPLSSIPPLDAEVVAPPDLPEVTAVAAEEPVLLCRPPSRRQAAALFAPVVQTPETWPRLVDYMKAISNPRKSFKDPELQNAVLALDHLQIKARTGEHGAVFRFHAGGKDIAVKVFLLFDPDLEERLRRLHDYIFDSVETADLRKYFVDFQYIADGIRVGVQSYPVVKMEWVEGESMFDYVERERARSSSLVYLRHKFVEMMGTLDRLGVVHGDLNVDNIIVSDRALKLVDYDMVRVPAARALLSPWHRNPHFAHPRSMTPGDELTDNFAAWSIATSLSLLSLQPGLWNEIGVKPGHLLFQKDDWAPPWNTRIVRLAKSHFLAQVRQDTQRMLDFANAAPNSVPALADTHALSLINSNHSLQKKMSPAAVQKLTAYAASSTAGKARLQTRQITLYRQYFPLYALICSVCLGFAALCGGAPGVFSMAGFLFFATIVWAIRQRP